MNSRLKYSVNSFSYYQSLYNGNFTIYDYIKESAKLKCSELDPWFGHFTEIDSSSSEISEKELIYLENVRAYAEMNQLLFQLITVDGETYIYDSKPEKREQNQQNAKKWIEIARILGAKGVRFDASRPEETIELDEDVLSIICTGFRSLIEYGKKRGVSIYIENHYGLTRKPVDMIRILDSTPDLYYLFDSWNWEHKLVAQGWLSCAKRASAVHIKTFHIKENNEDLLINLPSLLQLLDESGFEGCLTIETMPLSLEQERELINNTLNLIKLLRRESNE